MLRVFTHRLSYANVVATLALFLAVSGGAAYAASHYLITSTKQIKPGVLAQLKGRAGASGAQGPAGPQGPAGEKGAAGAPGQNGTNGTNGAEGKAGVSVTSATVPTSSSTCGKLGGSEFTAVEGKKTTACNGKEGQPWTAGGTLPVGRTEKGAWATTIVPTFNSRGTKGNGYVAISFGIPLAAAPTLVYVSEEAGSHSPECPGTAAEPTASEGFLCVYTATQNLATFNAGEAQVMKVGSLLLFEGGSIGEPPTLASGVVVQGTWAVTAGT